MFYLKNVRGLTRPTLSPIVLLSHDRAGSSWIGEILGTAPNVIYCYEPLNPGSGFDGFWTGWRRWLPKGSTDPSFERVFDSVFSGEIPKHNRWQQRFLFAYKRRLKPYRILVKEVGSVLAGEFFEERYGCKVIILIRHPAAVTASALKQSRQNAKKWQENMLKQPALLAEFPGLSALADLAESNDILMLRCVSAVYHILYKQACENKWPIIFYEDFCENPTAQFSKLFELLGLDFSEEVKTLISIQSSSEKAGKYSTQRISQRMIGRWKKDFSKKDIKKMLDVYKAFDIPWYASESVWY